MTTPERSVDEIVEEVWEKHTDYFKTDNGDEPFVYEDKLKKDIAQTLKAERQKREEAVEAERERILNILSNLVPREDGVTDVINDWIIPDLKRQITQPNNPK